jgi:hypothetical protein
MEGFRRGKDLRVLSPRHYNVMKRSSHFGWIEKLQDFVGETAWVVQVDHVAGIINLREMFVADDCQPLLFLRALRVVAVFTIDD